MPLEKSPEKPAVGEDDETMKEDDELLNEDDEYGKCFAAFYLMNIWIDWRETLFRCLDDNKSWVLS